MYWGDRGPGVVAGDDELAEVLVEDVSDDPHGELRLALEKDRGLAAALHDGGGLLVDALPLGHKPFDVRGQLLLAGALGGGAHMTPAESGTIRLRIFFRRLRSVSGSLREIPVMVPPGDGGPGSAPPK